MQFLYVRAQALDEGVSYVELGPEALMIERCLGRSVDFQNVYGSTTRLYKALESATSLAILHISAHGSIEGIALEGTRGGPSDVMTAEHLKHAISRHTPRLLVLAACQSLSLGQEIARMGLVPHIIASTVDIEQDTTVRFFNEFYELLNSGATVSESFECARQSIFCDAHSFILLPEQMLSDHRVSFFGLWDARLRVTSTPSLPPLPARYIRHATINVLFQIVDAFRTGRVEPRLTIIVGDAHGVGSSSIALDAAHHLSYRSWCPGGVVWVPASINGESLLQRIGRALGLLADASSGTSIEGLVTASLGRCSQRTLLVLDGLQSSNVQGCSCLSGGAVCHSAVCVDDAACISRILRASEQLVVLATTTRGADGDVHSIDVASKWTFESPASGGSAMPQEPGASHASGSLAWLSPRYILVSSLSPKESFFTLQHMISRQHVLRWAAVPTFAEWCWMLLLSNAAASAQLRFRMPVAGGSKHEHPGPAREIMPSESVFGFLRHFSDAELRTPGILGFNTPALFEQLEEAHRSSSLDCPIGWDSRPIYPWDTGHVILDLRGNLAALSLFADRVQDTRLFHVPPGVARACAEEAVAPASLRRPTYAAPPPLTAADRAALWPALSLGDSSGTSAAAALATPPLLRAPAGEASVPVPPPLVAPRLAACPTDVGDPTPVCHAEAVTPAPSLPAVAAASAVSAAGSARASGGTARGGTASRPPPSSPSAPLPPSLDDLLDLSASKADVIAALRTVRRDGAFVISGSERRASEGGLKLTFLTAVGSPPTLKLRLLRIDCVSGPRALAAGLPADDATGCASGGSGRLYRVVTGTEEDPSGTPGPALPVAVPAPQAAGANVRHGPTQAGTDSHGVNRIPGLTVASSRQLHAGGTAEELQGSTSRAELTQAAATGICTATGDATGTGTASGDATGSTTLPLTVVGLRLGGTTGGGYSLGALLAGLISLREAVVVRPPPNGAARTVVPKAVLVSLLQADMRYI